jgi:hypothetical protein
VLPPQLLLSRQATQVRVAMLQTGVLPPQVASERHCTHWPLPLLAEVSQAGVAPPQPAPLARQVLQVFEVVSQTGLAPPQVLLFTHATHWPPETEVSQTGRLAVLQPALEPPRQVTHTPAPLLPEASQMGRTPPQPALPAVRQVLQVLEVVSQTGVAPPHCELERHWTHWPPGTLVSQTLPPPQPAAAVQVTHWPAPLLPEPTHTGVAPPQPALPAVRQVLQVFEVVSQTGVVPPHWALERHWTHWPPPLLAATSQTVPLPQPWVAVQVLQVLLVGSHTAPPVQLASERQPTQVPPGTEVSQTLPAAQPAVAVQVMHWPAPLLPAVSQTGVAPEQPAPLGRQLLQLLLLTSQMGVAPEQWVLARHCTQRPPATVVSQMEPVPQPWVAVQVMHWPAPLFAAVLQTGVAPEQPVVAVQTLH